MKIILGSKSVGRKQVLEDAGIDFEIMVADVNEKAIRSDDYVKLPLMLAQEKAKALLPKLTEPSILITSDQIVVCNGELREKPESKDEAFRFLMSYSHHPAQTNTSVVVINTQTGKRAEGVDIAKVFFKQIPEKIIQTVVEKGDIMRAAGGFIMQDPLIRPYVDYVEGDEDSVIGLPMKMVNKYIKAIT